MASRGTLSTSRAPSSASTGSTLVAPRTQHLQRGSRSNHAMQSLLHESVVQPKLNVSKPGDHLERQADRVADAVMGFGGSMQPEPITTASASSGIPVARKCAACEADDQIVESRVRPQDDLIEVHAKRDGRAAPETELTAQALGTLNGGGEPMAAADRAFFEQRMGHDFSAVRIHRDHAASDLAAAAHARAFTHANHLVFRSGEYSPSTIGGRHLIAHELAHTIQQGASASRAHGGLSASVSAALGSAPHGSIQRVCETTPPPAAMTCDEATNSVGGGTAILFGLDASVLSAADRATISAIAAAWHSGGENDTFRIDGFASCDGAADHNWLLSCQRAQTVARELEAPTDGSPGVDAASIEVLANGETSRFSTSVFALNRRVEITNQAGTPPPGPRCPLTITGPIEVDHYCAAYVPSDAAACGVFPAPNITLNVTGAAPGALLAWSVTRGRGLASIVGPNIGANVDIRGDAASAAQGDVTVQVSDGSCTATTFLTVREPSDITPVQAPATTPTTISNIITYTVRDQFGNPMGADICVDETITVCANSLTGNAFRFGDAGTDAAGQVTDRLRGTFPGGVPADLCVLLNQSLTAGGCGPLVNNTILFQAAGITLNRGASCAAGDPCP